jgi:hypothetical protein
VMLDVLDYLPPQAQSLGWPPKYKALATSNRSEFYATPTLGSGMWVVQDSSLWDPTRQLRWRRRKNPQCISDFGELSRVEDTLPVFSPSPPCFVKTLKMLTTEPLFTTLLRRTLSKRAQSLKLPMVESGVSRTFGGLI